MSGDLAHGLARRRSQDYKSKIAEWDSTGVDVFAYGNEHVTVERPNHSSNDKDRVHHDSKATRATASPDANRHGKRTSSLAYGKSSPRAIDLERKAWVRRRSKQNNSEWVDGLKDAVAPKMRVISDGHWRKDAPHARDDTAGPAAMEPTVVRRSVATIGFKVAPVVQEFEEERPVLGRRTRSRSDLGHRHKPSLEEYAGAARAYLNRFETSEATAQTSSSVPHEKPLPIRPAHSPRSKLTKRRPVPLSPQADEESHSPDQLFSKKIRTPGGRYSPPRKPVAAAAGPSSRIEGWLGNLPEDPFTTNASSVGTESSTVDTSTQNASDDESPRKVSIRHVTDETSQEFVATPTLKRTGARRTSRSPTKEPIPESSEPTTPTIEVTPDRPRHGRTNADLVRETRASPRGPRVAALSPQSSRGELRGECGLKRRLTKHEDLISSLSGSGGLPVTRTKTIRTRRVHQNASDIMRELAADEMHYQRELRTLVDGVIPVLLSHVIQNGHNAASRVSGRLSTQPIVDMGVALEKLKMCHRRIPMHDPLEMIKWADDTSEAYGEYVRSWRLGFQEFVVNLAPAEDSSVPVQSERVDVAYLLKRPLVRLKTFAQIARDVDRLRPDQQAAKVAETYSLLVHQARQRANEERARLEDEAAASIDPTRSRDPCSLVALAGVHIDKTRSVRARDFFDLDMYHSNGQQICCKVELIARDDVHGNGNPPTPGDILICEVSAEGRWLLFPPLLAKNLSARRGDRKGEIVVMVRGKLSGHGDWQEILSLQSNDVQGAEWIDMLGTTPVPPRLSRVSSFNTMGGRGANRRLDGRPPTPPKNDIPIGEQASRASLYWDGSDLSGTLERSEVSSSSNLSVHDRQYSDVSTDERARDHAEALSHPTTPSVITSSSRRTDFSVWMPSSMEAGYDDERDEGTEYAENANTPRQAPPKRVSSLPTTPDANATHLKHLTTPTKMEQEGASAGKMDRFWGMFKGDSHTKESPPPTPSKSSAATPSTARATPAESLPALTPISVSKHRRSSSPLKHEYAPSSGSEYSEDSDVLSDIDEGDSVTSDSSADERVSTIGELKHFNRVPSPRAASQPLPQSQRKPIPPRHAEIASPTDSRSQSPSKSNPEHFAKVIASVFAWSDNGTWQSLHPQECEVYVTAGLVEVFDIAQANQHSDNIVQSPSTNGVKPLIALELTPLVPLRRGTALDISIRSPPTANSLLRTGNNIMLRSRSPEDCERLYTLLNRSRIDNPTWIAMQQAQGPAATGSWAQAMDARNSARGASSAASASSWFRALSRKSSTYRSRGRSTGTASRHNQASLSADTSSSAFSALRRFSNNRLFNIAKSTISAKDSAANRSGNSGAMLGGLSPHTLSLYSSERSSNRPGSPMAAVGTPGTPGTPTSPMDLPSPTAGLTIDGSDGAPLGPPAKIRLYARVSASKWRDMGSGRLTILAPQSQTSQLGPGKTEPMKRILIVSTSSIRKGGKHVLLDATLPEASFERVARTGLAVKVVDEGGEGNAGLMAATGGVVLEKERVWMARMGSEREAAYTFSLVGSQRY